MRNQNEDPKEVSKREGLNFEVDGIYVLTGPPFECGVHQDLMDEPFKARIA